MKFELSRTKAIESYILKDPVLISSGNLFKNSASPFEADTITGYMHELLSGILDGLKGTGFDLKIVSPGSHKSLDEIMHMHGLDGVILPHCYKEQLPGGPIVE